jgi:hypothetical protein
MTRALEALSSEWGATREVEVALEEFNLPLAPGTAHLGR